MDPVLYSISDVAQMLSIGRTTVYRLIADGTIRVTKVGRRTLVPRSSITSLAE